MFDIFALECMGSYGYGNGFFFKDANREFRSFHKVGLHINVPLCCQTCPARVPCWDATKQRAEQVYPDQSAALKETVQQLIDQGMPPMMAAGYATQLFRTEGTDPYYAVFEANVELGHMDRQELEPRRS